jgi:hypothetical protein
MQRADRDSPRTARRGVGAIALGLLGIIAAWLLATPLGSGVDEVAHIVTAVADAHLSTQRAGDPDASSPVFQMVPAAGTFALLYDETLCVVARGGPGDCRLSARDCRALAGPDARCGLPLVGDAAPSTARTWTGRYPPVYPFLVGLPTLLTSTPGVIGAMRAISAAMSWALLLGALLCAAGRGRRPLMGVATVAVLTPTVLGTAVIVNPSGLEISASIALWTSGTLLATTVGPVPRRVTALAFVAAGALVVARPTSVVWAVVIISVLLVLAGRHRIGEVMAGRGERIGMVALCALALASVLFVVEAHATMIITTWLPQTTSQAASWAARSWGAFVEQSIGNLGTGVIAFPTLITAIYEVVLAAVVLAGLVALRSAERKVWAAVGLLVLACVAAPVVLASRQVPEVTPYGRYLLPLLAGLPIVLSSQVAGGRRWARVGIVSLCLGQLFGLVWLLHRWTVGPQGPWWAGHRVAGEWTPVIPTGVIVVLASASTVLLAAGLWTSLSDERSDREPVASS